MAKMKISEAKIPEQYRVALENVVNQTAITTIMVEFGYNETLIAEGKALWQATNDAYEISEAYGNFSTKRDQLATAYSMHRRKAKVIFRKDELTANKLGITGTLPNVIFPKKETVYGLVSYFTKEW